MEARRLQRRIALSLFVCLLVYSLSCLAADQASDLAPTGEIAAASPNSQLATQIAELEKRIVGQENKPAEEVFKNIQTLKGMPAGRMLPIMRIAFSASLGVACTHCHVAGEWEKDDKPAKATARKMWELMMRVNKDIQATLGKGGINCTTCHRGQIKPALSLPASK